MAPERVAVVAGTRAVTYGDLDRSANVVARRLRSAGVGRGDVVGICLDRSPEEIVARLAVMRAGAAFLPFDPDWPAERIGRVVAQAGARLVLGDQRARGRLVDLNCAFLDAGAADTPVAAPEPPPVWPDLGPADLAYVIFTSGSTGEPKCVELTHGNLAFLTDWHIDAFAATARDRVSHLAGLGFDASVWDVWPNLCAGATLVLPEEGVRGDAERLRQWLVAERITLAYVPTVLAQSLIRAAWPAETRLRTLLTGGEALRAFPAADLPFAVVNCYGPSECTVVATAGVVPPESVGGAADAAGGMATPTIGRAIAGARVRIVDDAGRAVARGAPGELWIEGDGVGRGYRGDPALTAERFVNVPDGAAGGASGYAGRAYRTGDRVCERDDGEIVFLGRVDRQEKVRGVRIETDEIVLALSAHPMVGWSDVVAVGEGADRRLVAYVLPAQAGEPSATELRDFLAARLPEALIPAAFLRLDALPLTGSGKLDRARLPDPATAPSLPQEAFRAPESPTERRLAEIIGAILGVERVGADDNFFLLGGHSLLGTRVVLQARAAFGVDLTLRHLFGAQTVAELASVIETMVVEKLEAMQEDEVSALVAE